MMFSLASFGLGLAVLGGLQVSVSGSVETLAGWRADPVEDADGRKQIQFQDTGADTSFTVTPQYWYGSNISDFHQYNDWLVVILPATSSAHTMLIVNSQTQEHVEELGFHPSIAPSGDRMVYEKFYPRFMPEEAPQCPEVLEIHLGPEVSPRKRFPVPGALEPGQDPCDCRPLLPVVWNPDGTKMAYFFSCSSEPDLATDQRHWSLMVTHFSHPNQSAEVTAPSWQTWTAREDAQGLSELSIPELSLEWNQDGHLVFRLRDGTLVEKTTLFHVECSWIGTAVNSHAPAG